MKGKNSHVFLLKKVGGALIRGGALNRDYTVHTKRLHGHAWVAGKKRIPFAGGKRMEQKLR